MGVVRNFLPIQDMEAAFERGEISDWVEFFRRGALTPLCHDRFPKLTEELREALLSGDEAAANLLSVLDKVRKKKKKRCSEIEKLSYFATFCFLLKRFKQKKKKKVVVVIFFFFGSVVFVVVMFCRDCGFRVRLYGESYRNFQKFRVRVRKCYRTRRKKVRVL